MLKCNCNRPEMRLNIISKFEIGRKKTTYWTIIYWTIIKCINCNQIISREPYKEVKSKPLILDTNNLTEYQLKNLTIGD